MRAFDYPGRPIGSIASLAAHLDIAVRDLERAVGRAGLAAYRVVHVDHDGNEQVPPKVTYDAHRWLKDLQQRINDRILRRISYPKYVVGGVPGRSLRDAIEQHAYARSLLTFDIKRFFENTRSDHVRRALRFALRCPPEVADTICSLCTVNQHLPRGAPTSSYLANIVFVTEEPTLVAQLESLDPHRLRYTRWVDDITVSSTRTITREIQTLVTAEVSAMLRRRDLEFTREKEVPPASRRKRRAALNAPAILVHGIEVRGGRLIVPKHRRRELRAGVHELLQSTRQNPAMDHEALHRFRQLRSRAGYMKHFDHRDIRRLEATLAAMWQDHLKAIASEPACGLDFGLADASLDPDR